MKSPERLVAEYDMLPEGTAVLCAVSGGADSICLLHWLVERGCLVHAAHYNHQLRGDASDRDEAFVTELCRAWGVPLHVGRADVAAEAAARGQGMEETARAMRYAFLADTAKAVGAARIATAHTADDNLETILLHLTRGCGLRGLAGIPPRRGNIVRPFLETERAEIVAVLDARGIAYVQDASNADERFSRNRIRARVIPVLRGINEGVVANAARTARVVRAEDAYLDRLAARCDLFTDNTPLAIRKAALLLRDAGQDRYSEAHLRGIVALARGNAPSGTVHLPNGLTAVRSYGRITVTRDGAAAAPAPVTVHGPGRYRFGDWAVTVTAGICPEKNEKKADTFWLDCDRIVGEITLRARAGGDRIRLPGRRTKTLQRLFIAEKVPASERAGMPVLADARGVLAVCGLGAQEARMAAPGKAAWRIKTEKWESGTSCTTTLKESF